MSNQVPTENEIIALQCCIDRNSSPEYMLSDPGCVMAGHPEIMKALNWNKKQVAALLGSMEEKGFGTNDGNYGNGHIFWPSYVGYKIAFNNLNK